MPLRFSTAAPFRFDLAGFVLVVTFGFSCLLSCNSDKIATFDNNKEHASTEELESVATDELFRSEFSTERFEASISSGRCAIIYRGYYPFSIGSPNTFAKLLMPPFQNTDYYRYDAEWGNPSVAPFYQEFGLSKEGTVVVVLPNGDKRCFSLSSSLRDEISERIELSSRIPHE